MDRHQILEYFTTRDLRPAKFTQRHDGTVELTWHVDDCDERYVRVTSSVRGPDHVLVARDQRRVDSVVLDNVDDIFCWVRGHLEDMVRRKMRDVPDVPDVAAEVGEGG